MLTYYVNPTASADGIRTFPSVEAARDAVRTRIAEGLPEPITILLAAGEYRTSGILFDARDSGTADCPITYRAEGNVILNGGLPLSASDFEAITPDERDRLHGNARDKVVRVNLRKLSLTPADWGDMAAIGSYNTASRYQNAITSPMWCELFVNDRRMEIARYPDTGYLSTGEPVREGKTYSPTAEETAKYQNHPKFPGPPGDIVKIDEATAKRTSSWKTLDDVWTFGYPFFGWADASSPVERIDPDTCEMETRFVSNYGLREHAPYYFFNVFEELDTPGEWYLDRTSGMLYLYPESDLSTAKINLSLLTENLIRFDHVSYVTLSGITFTGTRTDALNLTGDHLLVENCKIKNVAGNAILLTGNDCTVRDCEISRTGHGGIRITGGDRATLTPSGNVVTNNHIHHIAEIYRTYRPAVQIAGVGCLCSHNCIHDSAHMAIGFGGNNHIIEYNEIYEVCQIADDSGAIYSGRDYTTCGNVIRCNFFHDMRSEADNHIGIFGVYCDDNLGSCTIEKNVFLRCQSALLLHGGHDMTFRNNLVIESCPKSQYSLRFHRYGYWTSLVNNGEHVQKLAKVPWEGDVWSKAYPHLREYLSWDAETEQPYPHYGRLTGNILINHKPIDVNFDWRDPRWKDAVENNVETAVEDIRSLTWDNLHDLLPEFEEIPFDDIGIRK